MGLTGGLARGLTGGLLEGQHSSSAEDEVWRFINEVKNSVGKQNNDYIQTSWDYSTNLTDYNQKKSVSACMFLCYDYVDTIL